MQLFRVVGNDIYAGASHPEEPASRTPQPDDECVHASRVCIAALCVHIHIAFQEPHGWLCAHKSQDQRPSGSEHGCAGPSAGETLRYISTHAGIGTSLHSHAHILEYIL